MNTKITVKLVSMLPRDLELPTSAFFLFGPRGTGKSTWVRNRLPDALVVDLLPADCGLWRRAGRRAAGAIP